MIKGFLLQGGEIIKSLTSNWSCVHPELFFYTSCQCHVSNKHKKAQGNTHKSLKIKNKLHKCFHVKLALIPENGIFRTTGPTETQARTNTMHSFTARMHWRFIMLISIIFTFLVIGTCILFKRLCLINKFFRLISILFHSSHSASITF